MKRLRTRADVTEDLANIYAWLAERNPRAAREFLIAVDDTFKEIGRNPGSRLASLLARCQAARHAVVAREGLP